jgi:hypothetical protein
MAKSEINFDTVRKVALGFPGVEDGTSYGELALKVNGKLLACAPAHRSAEPGSLVVKVDIADRAQLLAEAPDVYYVTDHYVGYPTVLVRLSRIDAEALRGLLVMAHHFVTRKSASRAPAWKARKPAPKK